MFRPKGCRDACPWGPPRGFKVGRAITDTSAPSAEFITPVLVIWGKARLDMLPTSQETATGNVIIVGGRHLRPWLELQGKGYIGPDYAHDLAEELRRLAEQRVELNAPESRLIRWFARAPRG